MEKKFNDFIKNSGEYILCASIWYKDLELKRPDVLEPNGFRPYNVNKGIVFSGWRHHNCLYQMVAMTGKAQHEVGEEIQGFLTSKNRFVDREEGAKIAYEAGQIGDDIKILYSEDLYPRSNREKFMELVDGEQSDIVEKISERIKKRSIPKVPPEDRETLFEGGFIP